AMDAARPGGRVLFFAQTQHGEATFDPAVVCMDEKTLLGSYSSSFEIEPDVETLVFDGYRSGFDLTPLISHRFPLEEAVEAIRVASNPTAASMKVFIHP
ncbi:MAG: Zn-dependent alcohol dehydrogenase, partial [Acidobacteriaceae bacterium]